MNARAAVVPPSAQKQPGPGVDERNHRKRDREPSRSNTLPQLTYRISSEQDVHPGREYTSCSEASHRGPRACTCTAGGRVFADFARPVQRGPRLGTIVATVALCGQVSLSCSSSQHVALRVIMQEIVSGDAYWPAARPSKAAADPYSPCEPSAPQIGTARI
jgi:hypothetical protein